MSEPTGNSGQALLQKAWDYFKEVDTWPAVDHIDTLLFREGIHLEEALAELSSDLVRGINWNMPVNVNADQRLQLTFAGAFNCNHSGPEISMYLRLVELAVSMECGLYGDLTVRTIDANNLPVLLGLNSLPGDPRVVYRAVQLATQEPAFSGTSFHPAKVGTDAAYANSWALSFDRRIRAFFGVTESAESYWVTRQGLLHPSDPEPPSAPPTPSLVVPISLHPEVADAAAERFESGQYADAVMRAFQAVEHRVQNLTGSSDVGVKLMGAALGSDAPKLVVTRAVGPSLPSEREGFRDLFKGALAGLRNPRAHGPHYADDPDEAKEMLAFASLLMRRLDHAEAQLTAQAAQGAAAP
ncbi:TIGR02391 family protein [Streptomyces murinus]|uniref:TIGR02391 family protein n=1 Tax=Streptomyces murinus TaxID=33900 RepID=UPI003F489A9B